MMSMAFMNVTLTTRICDEEDNFDFMCWTKVEF